MKPAIIAFLLFLIGLALAQEETLQRYSFKDLNQKIISNNTVVGADEYMTLFIWKTLNITTLEQLYKRNDIKFFSYSFTTSMTSDIMYRVIPNYYGSLRGFSGSLNSWKFTRVNVRRQTVCMRGSILENFDVLMDLPQYVARRVRMDRNHLQKKKTSSDFLNISDFVVLPLFPTKLYMVSNSDLKEKSEVIKQQMLNIVLSNSTLENLTCLDSITHDARVMERSHGIVNFTNGDLQMVRDILNASIQEFKFDHSIVNYAINEFEGQAKDSSKLAYFSSDDVGTQVWPSSCHYCTTPSCVGENWANSDWLDMTVVFMGFVFYTFLFGFKLFLHPVFKRRMGLVFLGPLFNMILFVSLSTSLVGGCISIGGIVVVYSVACLISIYSLTVVRYYYLRNLYWFLEKSSLPKLHKVVSNYWLGLFISTMLPLILCIIFTIPEFVLYLTTWDISVWDLSVNISMLILAIFSSLLGFLCILLDLSVNWRIIKEKGFRYFFLFNDPMYVRIDLLSLLAIIILLVLVVVANAVLEFSYISTLRFLIGLCVYQVVGGNSMIVVFILRLNSKLSSTKTDEDEYISLLGDNFNQSFYALFRDYCTNESSLENIMLFDLLKDLRANNCVRLKDLKHIQEIHLNSFSSYEVNVSHSTKSKINTIIRDLECNPENTLPFSDIDFLRTEVTLNIKDTYSRFSLTPAFREWRQVQEIQKKNNV